MNLLKLLSGDGFVMYNYELARDTSPAAATIYGAILRGYETFKNQLLIHEGKEYFFMTAETMEEYTAYKRKPQDRAITELINYGLIETALFGLPAKRHFHVTDKIYTLFKPKQESKFAQNGQTDNGALSEPQNEEKARNNQLVQNGQTRTSKTDKQERPKRATNIDNLIKDNLIREEEEEKAKRALHVVLSDIEIDSLREQLREEYNDVMENRSFNPEWRKIISKHKKGAIKIDFEGYARACLDKKAAQLETDRQKRAEEKAQQPEKVYTRGNRSSRKEKLPEWLEEQKQREQEAQKNNAAIDLEAERAALEKELQMYKK